ncbi:MAG: hypothetical protein ACE5H1_08325 [Thermodesulfobacteriota bacterium]
MALTIYCSWCSEHEFKVDPNTVHDVRILMVKCPKCEKITTIGSQSGSNIIVLPGAPTPMKPGSKDKTTDPKPD